MCMYIVQYDVFEHSCFYALSWLTCWWIHCSNHWCQFSVVRHQTLHGMKLSRSLTTQAFRLPAVLDLNCLSMDCSVACRMSFQLKLCTICGRTRRDRYLLAIVFLVVSTVHCSLVDLFSWTLILVEKHAVNRNALWCKCFVNGIYIFCAVWLIDYISFVKEHQ